MDAWAWIAEQRILEAMGEGFFDSLERAGRPLDLEEALAVPPDRRLAYKVLANAGFAPPEVELRREIEALRRRISAAAMPAERTALVRQVNALVLRVNLMERRPVMAEFPQVTEDRSA